MAIKPLTERLDELNAVNEDVADIQASQPAEPLPEPIEYTTEPTPAEPPVDVAGIGSAIKGAIKNAPRRKQVEIIPKGEDVAPAGPYQVIPEAPAAKAEQILQEAPIAPVVGKPPETTFNLDQITGQDGLKQFIDATANAYGANALPKISYKEVATKAAEEGYDEAFLARIIDPTKATAADPATAYKMLLAITDAGKRAFELGEKVKAAKIDGKLTAELASEFHQAVALEGVLLKAAKGRQADIARTLGIFSQARTATVERGAQLDDLIKNVGGLDNSFDLATKYTALDSRAARATLSEKTVSGTVKDIWFSTWINGLLSSPVTHIKNIAGNMFFGALQIPERAVASVIGKARNKIAGGEEAIDMDEVYSMAYGFLQGIREGGPIALTALKKNEATDAFTKIENLRSGREAFDIDLGDSEIGKAMSSGLKYWGNFVTVPGRALMAEDEFFKAIGYRMELNAMSARYGKKEYNRLIEAGVKEEDAARMAQDYMSKILSEPPPDIDEAAKSFARTITFTRDLEPKLRGIQSFLQNPMMKMFVPFVRTPTNIALEAMSRTPLFFTSPRFWADFNAGGIRKDMAMGKAFLGSSLIFATGTYALEGKITGYGPFRKEDREALKATGWQEFSFTLNKSDVDEETLAKFREITSVNVGPDKVYISYAGLEPLSTLLSIASTAGEYSMANSGKAEFGDIMLGGVAGIYQYLSEQPMLTGFAELTKMFTVPSKDLPTFMYNLLNRVAKQTSEFAIGGSPVGAYSSLLATFERYLNPERSNVMESVSPEETNVWSGAAKGFFEAMNKSCSRNPACSDSLPPLLDPITGEVKRIGKGNVYEMFNPFKRSDGTYAPAYGVLLEYGIPQYQPDRKINGVELSAPQYNRLIELATDDGKLAKRIEVLGKSPQLIRMAGVNLASAQALIQKEISNAYSLARQLLINEDPDLKDSVDFVKESEKDVGKFKR